MFTPFTIHLAIFCYRWVRNKLKGRTAAEVCRNLNCRRQKCSNETNCCESSCLCLCFCFVRLNFKEVCYHLPFVQTFRNIYNAWRLHKLGYGRTDFDVTNSAEVEAILKEVGLAGQYESFFESGPQSITQCVIILSTGKISLMQMISITISVASLTWGAGRSFFIQREAHMSDPDPPALMVLARVFFYMFTVTFNSLLLWTFIGSLLGKYTVVAALLSFSTIYTSVKLLEKNEHEPNEVDGQEEKEAQYFCLKAAICSVWVPSVVGDRKRMFIVSAVIGLLSKLLLLGLAVGIGLSGNQHLVHRDPFLIWCQQLELVQERVTTEKTLEMCSFKDPSFPRCFEFGSSDTIFKLDDTEVKEKLANNETSINEVLNQVNTSKEKEISTEEIESSGNNTISDGNTIYKEISYSAMDEDILFQETNTTLNETKSQAHLI